MPETEVDVSPSILDQWGKGGIAGAVHAQYWGGLAETAPRPGFSGAIASEARVSRPWDWRDHLSASRGRQAKRLRGIPDSRRMEKRVRH